MNVYAHPIRLAYRTDSGRGDLVRMTVGVDGSITETERHSYSGSTLKYVVFDEWPNPNKHVATRAQIEALAALNPPIALQVYEWVCAGAHGAKEVMDAAISRHDGKPYINWSVPFSEVCRAWRDAKELTNPQAAALLETPENTWKGWLKGEADRKHNGAVLRLMEMLL